MDQLAFLAEISNGWIVVILMIATAALFLLEVFTPSFGALAIGGIICLIMAVVYAFQIAPWAGVTVLLIGIFGTPVYLYMVVRFVPRCRFGKHLILGKAREATNDAAPQSDELHALIGKTGKTITVLRPSGMIRVDGKRIDARAERGMIDNGQSVKIIRAGGTEVIVRLAEDEIK